MKKFLLTTLSLVLFIYLGSSQCFPDRHNTTWYDGWISCEKAANPNDAHEESHWIMYDLGKHYELGQTQIWNSNDPSHLDYGLQEVSIDYSADGIEWINLGDFVFDAGNGKSNYEGFEGPEFGGVAARYVLLTAISNYGGECYGLSEIKIYVQESTVGTEEVEFIVDCKASDDGMSLQWTMDGELNGVSYQIERREDTNEWTSIEETEVYHLGDGNHVFNYIDKGNTDRSAFYRLITHHVDGRTEVSNSHYCSNRRFELRVYPNPMDDYGFLEINSQNDGEIMYTILDNLGRKLLSDRIFPVGLSSQIPLDDKITESGHYIIQVRQGVEQRSVKLVKK